MNLLQAKAAQVYLKNKYNISAELKYLKGQLKQHLLIYNHNNRWYTFDSPNTDALDAVVYVHHRDSSPDTTQ
jgi:hypothetical protein